MQNLIRLLCVSTLLVHPIYGHEEVVHRAITANAAASVSTAPYGLGRFLNVIAPALPLKDATNELVRGSDFEDYRDEPGDHGGKEVHQSFLRSYNPARHVESAWGS